MKRSRDDEKSSGAMFPRLHVNDTAEKGGPRAPPRNKMALYEQLSIPSQRFASSSGLNPQIKPGLISSLSSTQGNGAEKSLSNTNPNPNPRHFHPLTPMPWSEKILIHRSVGADGIAMVSGKLEQRKKVGDTNEFTVPVLVKPRVSKIHHITDSRRESVSLISSSRSGLPVGLEYTCDIVRQEEVRDESDDKSVKDSKPKGSQMVMSTTNQSIPEDFDEHLREAEASADCDHQGHDRSDDSRFLRRGTDIRLSDGLVESTRDKQRSESRRVEDLNKDLSDGKLNRNSNGTCISLRLERVDKSDNVSEASMLESIYGSDIAPDDVVEIIGQKHFWKARTAIVNQQRVFAIQVFELHRLVKVQKLIAGSPDVLIEKNNLLRKSSSPVSKHPPKFIAKPNPMVEKHTDNSEKPSHKKECSTGNTVTKPPLSSTKNGTQSSDYTTRVTNPPPVATTTENKTDPWCFHQPPGPQWLVPVMSPSEGLVYKPYPGPGLPGAVYGGEFGQFGSHTPYGVQASHHQEPRFFPGTSPVGQPFFPPYGMPYSNQNMSGSAGEQPNNPFTGTVSHSQTGPVPLQIGPGLKTERHSSCNAPNPRKTVSVSKTSKFQASKGSDLVMGSTASSPGERRDPLPLFPVAPVASEGDSRSHIADQPNRVIKVVPHSRISATESAARIFRFIQEERNQINYG